MRIPEKYFFICESVEDLVRWCYPDILSLLFQFNCMLSEICIFESADSVKSGEQAGSFVQHLCFWTPPFKLSLKRLLNHMFRNRQFCTWQIYVALTQPRSSKKHFHEANCGKPIARHFSRSLRHPVMLTYTFSLKNTSYRTKNYCLSRSFKHAVVLF